MAQWNILDNLKNIQTIILVGLFLDFQVYTGLGNTLNIYPNQNINRG